jgi:acetyl esterase/lipase
MKLWPDSYESLRAEACEAMLSFTKNVAAITTSIEHDSAARIAMHRSLQADRVDMSDKGADVTVGGLPCRLFKPHGKPRGLYLHFHGGGLISGSAKVADKANADLCERLRVIVLSVDYRLAPEHPFPAAIDDGVAVALKLIASAADDFGTATMLIGGESAGGYISAQVLLRLRDRGFAPRTFAAANLVFAGFDLSNSLPAARGVRISSVDDVLSPSSLALTTDSFLRGQDRNLATQRAVSPLFADLCDMPPALFTVGSADHLLDDNILMAGRWAAFGNCAQLAVYPDCGHGFTRFDIALAKLARERMIDFFDWALEAR